MVETENGREFATRTVRADLEAKVRSIVCDGIWCLVVGEVNCLDLRLVVMEDGSWYKSMRSGRTNDPRQTLANQP